MDPVVRDRAWVEEMMNGSCVRFIFKIADSETLNFMYYGTASGQMELGGRTVTDKDSLARTAELPADRSEPAPPETDPAESSAPETETAKSTPAETVPAETQPEENSSVVYTFANGGIVDYYGEWEGNQYFKASDHRNSPFITYVLGVAPAGSGGEVRALGNSLVGYYIFYDCGVSRIIDGKLYVGTDRGYYTVADDGTTELLVNKGSQFRPYQSTGKMLLYSYDERIDENRRVHHLEAYNVSTKETVHYLTYDLVSEPLDKQQFIYGAAALDEEGFYYVLLRRGSYEVWYQPFAGGEAKLVYEDKNVILYAAGTKDVFVTETWDDGTFTTLAHFPDETLHISTQVLETWRNGKMEAIRAENGLWRFFGETQWFDLDVEKRTCAVYKTDYDVVYESAEQSSYWRPYRWTEDGSRLIMKSRDGKEMLIGPVVFQWNGDTYELN